MGRLKWARQMTFDYQQGQGLFSLSTYQGISPCGQSSCGVKLSIYLHSSRHLCGPVLKLRNNFTFLTLVTLATRHEDSELLQALCRQLNCAAVLCLCHAAHRHTDS